jgi:hypothetical protein
MIEGRPPSSVSSKRLYSSSFSSGVIPVSPSYGHSLGNIVEAVTLLGGFST